MHKHVVIVGAGISGLTCAYRLKQKNYDLLLIERDGTVGGVMQSRQQDGFLTETGPNSFQSAPEIMQLIEDLELAGELVTAPPATPRFVYYLGKLQEFPMSPPKLFSTALLSFGGKLRIFLEPFARQPSQPEESIADFISRRLGPQVLDAFVDPFVSGVYAGDPARLSIQSTFPMLADLEKQYGSLLQGYIRSRKKRSGPRPKRRLCSFKEGLGQLPQALAGQLGGALMTNAKVVKLETAKSNEGPRFRLEIARQVRTEMVTADAVVLAAPACVAARLVRSFSQPLADVLTSIEYPPLAVVCLGYDEAAIPRSIEGFGFLIPRSQGIRILGCLWSSSLFPGRAPDGKVCLTNFVGGATDPAVSQLSDDELVRTVHRELRITLGVRAEPDVVALHRYDRAIPQYNLGHQVKLRQIQEQLNRLPGLFLAGNYLRGISIGDCVREAMKAAESITRYLNNQG